MQEKSIVHCIAKVGVSERRVLSCVKSQCGDDEKGRSIGFLITHINEENPCTCGEVCLEMDCHGNGKLLRNKSQLDD